jgi:N-acetylglucosaminyl-diphospho-decaprenol L-rhamnosyltransferase
MTQERPAAHDLAVIIVSTNEADWLAPCLTTLRAHAGDIDLDVVVVDNASRDETAALVRGEFPWARVVSCENHGFAHANNRALATCSARYVLFLNPDTQVLEGQLADLVARLDECPEVGLAGCVQCSPEGRLWPSMRRFPSPLRALMEALGSERLPRRPAWMGTSELDYSRYGGEFDLDWTSGSFMLARREALDGAGWLDERFFLYSDDVDLARRIKDAGWTVRHFPHVRIVHHAMKAGFNPRRYAQYAYAKRIYARKHFTRPTRGVFLGALALRNVVRLGAYSVLRPRDADARRAAVGSLRVLAGRTGPPYEPPPCGAVRPHSVKRKIAA